MAIRANMTPAGQRVLDVASRLFYRDGINSVGVALVAETAEVTKKTLYDCFGSKQKLVVDYLRHRHEIWWSHLEQCLAEAGRPRTLTLVDAYLTHPNLRINRGCAFLNAAAELPADHPGLDVIRDHKKAVRARLADLVAEDAPAVDSESVAEHVFLLLEGAIAHIGIDDHNNRVQQVRQLATTLLDNGHGDR
ncbi:TetR/AcrR family transcriptional regulator [Halosaccharopolyspora lacisalsi]|uniref:TetR/AcrR family transcriptional regulator n=1 Tax=Halosaccharopolyspora lacisalsi TaxID=1000566 RepID=UPI002E2C810E|nr:TetR/AcrR family transcriptional regulator [Halosaccharopolyspora lacisalsi]